MRDEVAAVVPAAFACTTWGTPSLDLGAAVSSPARRSRRARCTTSPSARGSPPTSTPTAATARPGRFAGLVVLRGHDR